MDIRNILKQRDKISAIMLDLDDIIEDENTEIDPDYDCRDSLSIATLNAAIGYCEEVYECLQDIYEKFVGERE